MSLPGITEMTRLKHFFGDFFAVLAAWGWVECDKSMISH